VAGHASVTWLCEFDCDDGIEEEIERCAELNCEAYTDPECEFDPAGFVETPNLYEWCVENCEAMFGCVIDSCDPPSQENGPKAFCFARDPI
jgi:hypothetical protein